MNSSSATSLLSAFAAGVLVMGVIMMINGLRMTHSGGHSQQQKMSGLFNQFSSPLGVEDSNNMDPIFIQLQSVRPTSSPYSLSSSNQSSDKSRSTPAKNKVQAAGKSTKLDPLRQPALSKTPSKTSPSTPTQPVKNVQKTTNHSGVINPHPFQFRHLPLNACRLKSDLFLLTIVHTAPINYKRRMQIRETYGSSKLYPYTHNVVLFALGSPNDSKIQHSIDAESAVYRDIIQENFLDSYKNLTYKGVMWLRYVHEHCSKASFILKLDDDIFVNIFNLVNHLTNLQRYKQLTTHQILCLVWVEMKVMRNPANKWRVSRYEWPHDIYPPYCSGSAYIITSDLASFMYHKSFQTRFFWIDDVYMTGLLLQNTTAKYKHIGDLYVLLREQLYDGLVKGFALFGHVPGDSLNEKYELWNEVIQQWKSNGFGDDKNLAEHEFIRSQTGLTNGSRSGM